MGIQAQMYPDILGFSFGGALLPSQDYSYMDNNNIHSTNNAFNTINNNTLCNDLVFNLQQKQHQHQLQQHKHVPQQQQQQQQQPCLFQFHDYSQNPSLTSCYSDFVNNITPTTTTNTPSFTATSVDQKPPLNFSHGFDAHLDNYSQEIDRYIVSQNERLRVALQQQSKKEMGEICRKLEAKGMIIMQQKTQEIAKATDKRRELEETITKVEAEKEAWKRMAVEKESIVISLNKAFEQAKEQSVYFHLMNPTSMNGVDDAESCCDDNNESMFKKEKKREEMEIGMLKCKVCKSGEASVLLLPCRHLCCCIACHTCLDACPLCHSLKKASIQAFFS